MTDISLPVLTDLRARVAVARDRLDSELVVLDAAIAALVDLPVLGDVLEGGGLRAFAASMSALGAAASRDVDDDADDERNPPDPDEADPDAYVAAVADPEAEPDEELEGDDDGGPDETEVPETARDAVLAVMAGTNGAGLPMHEITDRAVALSGGTINRKTIGVLCSVLTREGVLARPERGVYALA